MDLNDIKDKLSQEISPEEYQKLITTRLSITQESSTNGGSGETPPGEIVKETVDNTEDKLDKIEEDNHGPPMEGMEDLYNQLDVEEDDDYTFERIVDHYFEKGALHLKANFTTSDEATKTMDIPFTILKKDVPYELAKYIREKVVETRRGGRYNTWAKNTVLNYNWGIRRLYKQYRVYKTIKVQPRNVKNSQGASINA